MSIKTTVALLQAKNLTVTGVKSAPAKYPASLNTAKLPLCLTWAIEGAAELQATGALRRLDVPYQIECYVAPLTQMDYDGAIQKCYEITQALIEAYLDSDNALLAAGSPQVSVRTETALSVSPYQVLYYPPATEGSTAYHGLMITVTVLEKW